MSYFKFKRVELSDVPKDLNHKHPVYVGYRSPYLELIDEFLESGFPACVTETERPDVLKTSLFNYTRKYNFPIRAMIRGKKVYIVRTDIEGGNDNGK